MTRTDLRSLLASIDHAAVAALLHELGFELYRREIVRWRVLGDLADELLDRATLAARGQIVTRWLPAEPVTTVERRQRSRRLPATLTAHAS